MTALSLWTTDNRAMPGCSEQRPVIASSVARHPCRAELIAGGSGPFEGPELTWCATGVALRRLRWRPGRWPAGVPAPARRDPVARSGRRSPPGVAPPRGCVRPAAARAAARRPPPARRARRPGPGETAPSRARRGSRPRWGPGGPPGAALRRPRGGAAPLRCSSPASYSARAAAFDGADADAAGAGERPRPVGPLRSASTPMSSGVRVSFATYVLRRAGSRSVRCASVRRSKISCAALRSSSGPSR